MAREKSELHGSSCSYSKLYTPTWVWILSLGCMVPSLISQRSESEHVVLGWIIDGARGNESSGLIFTWKLIKDGGGRSAGKTTLRHGAQPAPTPRPQHAAVEGKAKPFSQSTTSRCIASPRHGMQLRAFRCRLLRACVSEHEAARHAGRRVRGHGQSAASRLRRAAGSSRLPCQAKGAFFTRSKPKRCH